MAQKNYLTRDEVLELVTVEVAYSRAKAEYERCEANRKAARDRMLVKLPLKVWVELFGVRLRRGQGSTGERFSLRDAKAAGYRLPRHLQRFVTPSRPTDRLEVEPAGDQACELDKLVDRIAAIAG